MANTLLDRAKDAIKRGAAPFLEHLVNREPVEQIPSEELTRRINLRDAVLRMASTNDFKLFHEDAMERGYGEMWAGIKYDKKRLLEMPLDEFHGIQGVGLRERVNGQETIFYRIASIIKEGNAAESMLEGRKEKKKEEPKHTNL